MKLKLAVVAALAIGLGVSQISTEKTYVWVLSGNRFTLTQVTGLIRNGSVLTVPAAQPSETFSAGPGIVLVRVPGQPTQISVETTSFWLRMSAPPGPGACATATPGSDQRAMAELNGFLYVCVPPEDPVAGTTWRWARAPLEFNW